MPERFFIVGRATTAPAKPVQQGRSSANDIDPHRSSKGFALVSVINLSTMAALASKSFENRRRKRASIDREDAIGCYNMRAEAR